MKMPITCYMTFPCNVALSFAHKQEERSMIESVWERERESGGKIMHENAYYMLHEMCPFLLLANTISRLLV